MRNWPFRWDCCYMLLYFRYFPLFAFPLFSLLLPLCISFLLFLFSFSFPFIPLFFSFLFLFLSSFSSPFSFLIFIFFLFFIFRPVTDYGLDGGPVDFARIQQAAAHCGETALGIKLDVESKTAGGGVYLNPDRMRQWVLQEQDELVVLRTYAQSRLSCY